MPLRLTGVNVRLNTDVAWWAPTTEQKNYIKTNYEDTGKRTEVSANGESGLTKTKVVTFADTTAKSQWDADSTIDDFVEERRTYNFANKITFNQTIENTS